MIDDLKDSPYEPIRFHDHPHLDKDRQSQPLRGQYKKRALFDDKEMVLTLASQIIERRELLKWNQYDLARAAGVAQPSVNRVETGSVNGLHLDVVLRIIKALSLKIELTSQD